MIFFSPASCLKSGLSGAFAPIHPPADICGVKLIDKVSGKKMAGFIWKMLTSINCLYTFYLRWCNGVYNLLFDLSTWELRFSI